MCLARLRVAAAEHEAPVGPLRPRGPDLLAVEHPARRPRAAPASARSRGRSPRSAPSSPGTRSPRRARCAGRKRRFCASVPKASSVGPSSPSPMWPRRPGPRARAYSSWKITCCVSEAPRPPHSARPADAGPAGLPEPALPARAAPRRAAFSLPGPPAPRSAANSPPSSRSSQPAISRRKASSSVAEVQVHADPDLRLADPTIRYVPYATNRRAARGAHDPRAGARGRRALRRGQRRRGRRRHGSLSARSGARRCARRARSSPPASRPATASRSGRPTRGSGSRPRSASRPPAACWSRSTRAGRAGRRAMSCESVGLACSARSASSSGASYPALLAERGPPRARGGSSACAARRSGALAWHGFPRARRRRPRAQALARAEAVSPDALSDLLFTSGTTGRPKGVMTSHAQNLRAFAAWSEVVGLREGDRYLVVNPFFHAFGYKAGWLASLMRGATVLPHAVFDVPAVLERVGKERVSVLPGPPTLYQSILAHPDRARYDLSALRLAVTGAAAIPVELIHRMRRELGFETIITGYGLTECCGIVSMCRYDDPSRDDRDHLRPRDPRHRGALRRPQRQGGPARRAGRGGGARLPRDAGLLRGRRGDAQDHRRRGLAAHRRRRRDGRARLPAHHRPDQGHVHHGRLQLLSRGDREPALLATAASRRRR